jgi:phosphomannomutase/phosphoglucomutase
LHNAYGDSVKEIYNIIKENKFIEGNGSVETLDITDAYISLILDKINLGERKIKVVYDCGNGTTAIIADKIFEKLNVEAIPLFNISDGTFPNHHPDPCVYENLIQLRDKVLETNADLGVGFDGDGDRVGFIDNLGNMIEMDKFLIIMWRYLVDKVDKLETLYDVKCSKTLEDEMKKLGIKATEYRTGNSYTKAAVRDNDLPFGGELSGHVYFRDRWPGFDSGLYAGLRLLELLSKTDKRTSQLLDGITNYYSTEEIKISSPDKIKFTVVDKVVEYCKEKGYDINTIDGVRATFKDGWALVRCSNTGPNITVRFESETQERLEEIQQEFLSKIEEYNKE